MAKKRKTKVKTANDSQTQTKDKLETATDVTSPATTTTTTSTSAATAVASKPPKASQSKPEPVKVQQDVDPIITLVDSLLPPEPGMEHLSTTRVLLVGTALLAVGTLGFYYIPGMIAKDVDFPGNHLINSFYCAAITLTTVGFGDICPGDTGTEGKIFLLMFSFAGLGIFCGPIVQLGAAWRHAIPGGVAALGTFILGLGVTIFTVLEGLDHFEAIYASIITGTTIGYGDITPKTDAGKVAVALYAIISVHAVAILLDPAREYLEKLCRRPKRKPASKKKVSTKQD